LYSYRDHLDLHSFPTRRSSDLAIRWLHWINFPVLEVMIWSGLLLSPIFMLAQDAETYFTEARNTNSADIKIYCYTKAIAKLSTEDRKSTRLNSSHVSISYAVFC